MPCCNVSTSLATFTYLETPHNSGVPLLFHFSCHFPCHMYQMASHTICHFYIPYFQASPPCHTLPHPSMHSELLFTNVSSILHCAFLHWCSLKTLKFIITMMDVCIKSREAVKYFTLFLRKGLKIPFWKLWNSSPLIMDAWNQWQKDIALFKIKQ